MKRYFVLDGDLHYWAHTSRFDRGPHNLSGPGGVIGHVERSTEISDNTYWNLGLNSLVKSTGAVRVNRGTGRAGTPARSPEYGSRSNEPGGGSSEPPGHRHNHDHNQDQAAE